MKSLNLNVPVKNTLLVPVRLRGKEFLLTATEITLSPR